MRIVDADELDWTRRDEGGMDLRRKKLAAETDGEDIGASLYELPPGENSWPYHYHTGNEEALYVLAGAGALRHDGGHHDLSAGDYAAFPADERGAHRVINDGDEVLRYLVVSTMDDPDVIVYPDSEKVGAFAGAAPGGEGERDVHGYFRREDSVGYWDGEPETGSE